MRWMSRVVLCTVVMCLANSIVAAQATSPDAILANDNRVPGGKLENGVLNLSLEIRSGVWHAESEQGPPLFVQAFGETGKPAQIPGPLLRVRSNTTVRVAIRNTLKVPATVFGFVTRPASSDPGVEIGPNQTREITFDSGAPGTYFYWARTTPPRKSPFGMHSSGVDAQLNGAFIVDAPGPVPADRVLVINLLMMPKDVLRPAFFVSTINGKDYPYTEPLRYTMGATIRWRVINPSIIDHPMHLHGAFYRILSLGDIDKDTAYAANDQQSVVTEDLLSGGTMMMEWTPTHPGRWLFHCHYEVHIAPDNRVPIYSRPVANVYGQPEPLAGTAKVPDPKDAMGDMAGMMMVVNVKPRPDAPAEKMARNPRKIELVLQPDAPDGKSKLVSCSIREGGKVQASHDRSEGPPLVLTRDQPVEITVNNRLQEPTTIHWHGLELDSYYDGVMGAGVGDQVTPAIAPGGTFVVRFTPNRAGTFIYHTHVSNPAQLEEGVYGPIIVLNRGEKYDPEHDELIVIGTRDSGLLAKRLTVNGAEAVPEMSLERGVSYRVRVVNIAPDLEADVRLGSDSAPATWQEIAKDGAQVPARLASPENAFVRIVSGETYDFEIREAEPGKIPITVQNWVNKAELSGEIVVR